MADQKLRGKYGSGALVLLAIRLMTGVALRGQPVEESHDPTALLGGFRHVEAASVSDALEQHMCRRGNLSHRMRPIFPRKFGGFAVTVKLERAEAAATDSLNGMLTGSIRARRTPCT